MAVFDLVAERVQCLLVRGLEHQHARVQHSRLGQHAPFAAFAGELHVGLHVIKAELRHFTRVLHLRRIVAKIGDLHLGRIFDAQLRVGRQQQQLFVGKRTVAFQAAAVGINGLETALPLLLSLVREGILSPARFAEALSVRPAALLASSELGRLKVGGPANITVVDPECRWTVRRKTLHSKSHNTPFLDHEMTGAATMTLVDGRVIYERANHARA